ncbi:c-type cytochrome biogenesis protein CcmI [Zooshikella ganghwensis]|uniref:C-type cytochrome biogenesis protein CcmI n=1 Tax=Zooshikella ganghwensis TaxID=202772 RepID=A0A4P9VKZ6_9GAMM|nr:c-type cytochrome biogenesis protein CcmI [Zooshikella ganghwensis]RDH43446.1 c-type cytochrome biogenesis protein CcmI [Zooshikella ganghwensis]
MMLYWISLIVLALVAVFFILSPLLRKTAVTAETTSAIDSEDQEKQQNRLNVTLYEQRLAELDSNLARGDISTVDHQTMVVELQRQLLKDVQGQAAPDLTQGITPKVARLTMWGVAFIVPCLALTIYWQLGASRELSMVASMPSSAELANLSLPELTKKLESAVQKQPDNKDGWFWLARVYAAQQRYSESLKAYQTLQTLVPDDAEVMARLAETLYLANGNRMTKEVVTYAKQALQRQPKQQIALGLLGIAAFESGQYQQAIDHWQQILASGIADGEAQPIRQGIAKARQLLAEQQSSSSSSTNAMASASDSKASSETGAALKLQVLVEADPKLDAALPKTAKVYVLARPVGVKMPVAVTVLQLADLPSLVTLDDSQSMMPELKLSQQNTVDVVALVSATGDPKHVNSHIEQSGISVKDQKDVIKLKIPFVP